MFTTRLVRYCNESRVAPLLPIRGPISSPVNSIFITFSSALMVTSIEASIFIALKILLKNPIAISSNVSFLHTRIIAGLLNKPRIPELSFSITSYSTFSLVVSNSTKAIFNASSTVFAENSFHSDMTNSSLFLFIITIQHISICCNTSFFII